MMTDSSSLLDLNSLFAGRIGLTPSEGGHLAECAVVCYDTCGNAALPGLRVTGRHNQQFALSGPAVTNRMRRTYADLQEATEYGACGIAALAMEACEGLTICERAAKGGGGFDYYLSPLGDASEADSDNFLASATATLEVSGILQGTAVDLQYRLNEKIRQLRSQAQLLPCFIVIVGFSASTARIEPL